MIQTFMRSPLPNTLAVLVLVALITTWVTSIAASMKDLPVQTDRGWLAMLLPVFSILGIPAALDLLQTKGLTLLFSAIVLIVFILNIAIPIIKIYRINSSPWVVDWYKWTILLSSIGGLVVAGYLTFVEFTGAQVACGPSGGCIAVQNSRFAILFGFLPVGVLGLAGYVAILISWIGLQFGPNSIKKITSLAIWGMCVFGTLFSIYLTFLEPFVIGATCMWCISSAVLMIVLLLASTPGAQQSLALSDEQ